jgi:REP element-mobilizing transposase RayT
MPRQGRLDAPGVLHHVMVRGINGEKIFRDNRDYAGFLARLEKGLLASETPCYAWALMPNHVHLLLQTGKVSIGRVMARVLTGHAVTFNLRHRRTGKLYQNRFKSIVCDKEEYLQELVRYIHLNPLRSGIAKDLSELARYQWCGHGVLMGRRRVDWQKIEPVLRRFGSGINRARPAYADFVAEGVKAGHRPELTGGGLLRSAGGVVEFVKRRRHGEEMLGDERILGDGDFVERIMKKAEGWEEERSKKRRKWTAGEVIARAARQAGIEVSKVRGASKIPVRCRARALACYWLVEELGLPDVAVARHLEITPSAVSKNVPRGRDMIEKEKLKLSAE